MIIRPHGWPCKLDMCPPGFFVSGKQLCFKSEYTRVDGGRSDAYNSAGEAYHDSGDLVTPADFEWDDSDE